MNDLPAPSCADCVGFISEGRDEQGRRVGRCGLRPELTNIPETLPHCEQFRVRRSRAGQVAEPPSKPKPRRRRAAAPKAAPSEAHRKRTLDRPARGDTTGEIDMDRDGLKQVLRELLEEETLYGYPEMGARWEEGTLVLKPADPNNQPKEIPIEALFHKVVMVRDRLRVLEAKINAHAKLSEQDKVELQGYVTKCYGTLTTFNVLFRDKADHFRTR